MLEIWTDGLPALDLDVWNGCSLTLRQKHDAKSGLSGVSDTAFTGV